MTNTTIHDSEILYNRPYTPQMIYCKLVELERPLTDDIIVVLAIKIAASFFLHASLDHIYIFISNNTDWITAVIINDFIYYHPANTIIDNFGLRWIANCLQSFDIIEHRRQNIQKWNTYFQSIDLGNRVSSCFPRDDCDYHYNRYLTICNSLIDGSFCLITV